ncbi:hypothetical protein H6S82_15855 [Planktothrix sp. FACHB-1355]|uniref:Uncharacterized protein n=1 Tax=Aerosakkonema funiforme FACHB-1375 TaxID=2949571 RepID=A0A926ZIG0_9CYAN|nr:MULTISPECIES: hypothetical protein [Oscillatoriales]MBD2181731.1 hypothetical protein [Aerosakkonema funiforme FACHB-1375]MBD3560316.1 hypothetical protein [Planktothrix sp. FACHB-1355]
MTTLLKTHKIYDEFIDFIAQGTTPETMTKFQFSETTKERIEDLVYLAKSGELSLEDKKELDELLFVDHLITMIKAKAHQYIQSQSE